MPASRLKLLVTIIAALTVVMLFVLSLGRLRETLGRTDKSQGSPSSAALGSAKPPFVNQASEVSKIRPEQVAEARALLQAVAAALRAQSSPDEARRILAELRASLAALPKPVAFIAVVAFLDTKVDAPTGLEFSVGPGGFLTGATSLRVFLLDCMAALDPVAAGSYATKILQIPTSPDEWAIGMRNYARAYPSPEGSAFLRQKAEDMIQNTAWRENPSGGFLEAFDVFVHTKDTVATPLLAKLVRNQDQPATAHASYLTLDRLIIAEPQAVFAQIEKEPALFKGRELMQANFLARADVSKGNQRAQVERYLLDATRTPAELAAFAGIYPNANYMLSQNLLTSTETPKHAELIARDRIALKVTKEWLADPQFQRIYPHLQTIRNRLQIFVSQTGEAPP